MQNHQHRPSCDAKVSLFDSHPSLHQSDFPLCGCELRSEGSRCLFSLAARLFCVAPSHIICLSLFISGPNHSAIKTVTHTLGSNCLCHSPIRHTRTLPPARWSIRARLIFNSSSTAIINRFQQQMKVTLMASERFLRICPR